VQGSCSINNTLYLEEIFNTTALNDFKDPIFTTLCPVVVNQSLPVQTIVEKEHTSLKNCSTPQNFIEKEMEGVFLLYYRHHCIQMVSHIEIMPPKTFFIKLVWVSEVCLLSIL